MYFRHECVIMIQSGMYVLRDCAIGAALQCIMMKEGFNVEEWTWPGGKVIGRGGVYRFGMINVAQG